MEKYFKPVRSPSDPDKSKTQKHHHHLEEPRTDRYTTCDYTDRNTDESYGHHYPDGHFYPNNHCPDVHQTKPFPQSEDDDFVYDRTTAPVTLSRASSSSITSSSSSSSSTSWFTEEASDTFSLRHAERPLHSLSCSNIHDVRRFCQLDNNTDPVVFATVKHGSNSSVCSEVRAASKKGKQVFTPLGHSRSEDAFVQGNGKKIAKSKLNRSLEFSEEDIMLGVTNGPKRAVSSSQLPSKGILKNKEPSLDIRKARSMEVLSPRVAKEQTSGGQKPKVNVEQAKVNFVQEKMKFSAFLDEITKQVISPSDLKILGLNANKSTINEIPDPPPQLPPKKQRESSVEGSEPNQQSKHGKAASNSACKYSADSPQSDTVSSYIAMNHHSSPPPHHSPYASHSNHHKSSRKDRRPQCNEVSGYERSDPHLTDGTSTSPELVQPKHRHKPMPLPRNQSPLSQHRRTTHSSLPSSSHGSGAGLGSESSSSKSDSSRTRETVSMATSSNHGNRYNSQHATEQHRGTHCEADHLQTLQEENADLHQNLLQTVVCIENLEAELQRTRDELIHIKEKYKSLLESHSGTQQANSLLQEHLNVETETLNSERQFMFSRVAQLTSELQDAHKTIAALENINVPILIKELLEKHFFTSAGAKQQFLTATTQLSHFPSSPKTDSQSYTLKVEEVSNDWLLKSEAGPQRPTAFTPFKHGSSAPDSSISGSCGPPISVPYNKLATKFATAPQPLYVQPILTTTAADLPPPSVLKSPVDGENCPRMVGGGVKVVVSDQPDVTAMSAQQILNDFVQQLWAQKENEERESNKQQQQKGEWGAGEQAGKAME